ncbi:MAG: RHS repeat-associated core domain-containing protein [Verrucomicrobiota bacterium]
MNMLSLPRFYTLRFPALLLALFVSGMVSLHAFNPDPDKVVVQVGKKMKIKVKGSNGGAKVHLTDVSDSGLVANDLNNGDARDGTGAVDVELTGVAPGDTTLTFSGTNNGGNVVGAVTVKIVPAVDTSAQNTQVAEGGDPVNTSNGEYFADEGVDLNLGGPMSLVFSRYVASSLSEDNPAHDVLPASLGRNRSHNFNSRILTPFPLIKRLALPSGRVLQFNKVGTKWVLISPLDVPFQLIEMGGNLLLGHPQTKQIWTYDGTGRLTKIEDGKGAVHTLSYTGANLTGVSDGLGRTLTLTYTGSLITKIADQAAREVNYTYVAGVLATVQDHGGQTTIYASDIAGRPLSVTHPRGNTPFIQSYNAGGKVVSQTMGGHVSTLVYNAGSTAFTDPAGNTLTDFYDSDGRLTSHVDQDGMPITMTYDSTGRRTSVTNREGSKTSFTYHAASGEMASLVNQEGRATLFAYTARTVSGLVFYDLTKITFPDGASRAYKYDAKGNLLQITDENGKAWKYTFNANGQVVAATNPLGGVTTYGYNPQGLLISAQPPDVGATQFGYDVPRGLLNLITRPGGALVTIAYDARDRVTSVTDPRGKVRGYSYNANDRVTKITDPDTNETNITYDVMDRVLSITDPLGHAASFTYNSIGRLASVQDPNGNTITATYNGRQMVESITDPGSQVWAFDYDEEGRVVGMYEPALPSPANSSSRRNRLGRLGEATDADGGTARIVRDVMQRITATVDPMGRQTNYGYDKMGRLLNVTEQGTASAKYDRDALGNIIKITDPNGGVWATTRLKSGQVTKNTDALGKNTTYTYTNRGKLSGAVFPDTTTTTLSYDAAGNLTQQQFSHAQGPNLLYGYDNQNRLVSANGITFERDGAGRLINCPQGGMDFEAHYDAGGRLTSVEYRDGSFIVTYSYDTRSRLVQVTDSVSNVDVDFSYDNQGHVTGITRTPGIDATFTYSPAGRMTRIQEGTVLDLKYSYNRAGDIITLDSTTPQVPAVTAATQTFKHGKAGEITTAGYTYDVLGRMTAAPGKTFTWNGVSNMVSYLGVDLAYNGLGHLVSRTAAGNTTHYQRHYALPGAPIVFMDAPGISPDVAYVCTPDGKLLYSVNMTTQNASFFHFDLMGSTLAVTDETEMVINAYAYGPYGEVLGALAGPIQQFTFLGRHGVRTEFDLYQMGARYYDPVTARFLSRDPMPPRTEDPESLNRYGYAAGNPLRYLDPNGCREADVSEIAAQVSGQSIVNGYAIYAYYRLFCAVAGNDPDDSDYDRFKLVPCRMEIPPPPAPDAPDVPWTESDRVLTDETDFYPPGPGDVVEAFPGVAVNDGEGVFVDPVDTLFGGAGNDKITGPDEGAGDGFDIGAFSGGGYLSGGVNVAAGDLDGDGRPDVVTVANTTVAENTVDGDAAAAQAVQQATLDFMINTYQALQSAKTAILIEIGVKGNGDPGHQKRLDAIKAIDENKKVLKKVIKGLGGTVPK